MHTSLRAEISEAKRIETELPRELELQISVTIFAKRLATTKFKNSVSKSVAT